VPALFDPVKKLAFASALAIAVLGLIQPGTAMAHILVTPDTSDAGQTQLYTLVVPTEKQSNTVKIEVQFPRTLVVLQLQAPSGWAVSPEKDGSGRILGVVFDGGAVPSDEFASFGVLAQNPNSSADLTWTAIQSYADGSEVQWVGSESSQFPAAVTHLRSPGVQAWLPTMASSSALVISLAALGAVIWRRGRARTVANGRSATSVRTPVDVA
jgi:uncharacterized protein YcnI